ncbi:MAG: hypothetical protein C0423_14005 [Methylibium sp.]|nr:hypothetical protein [Methylibium sp.]
MITLATLPALGQPLDTGLFCGVITRKDGTHCAVVLLADKPDTRLTWSKAKAWADGVGGQLPSRPVAALLYANAKDQLQPAWHWTSDTLDADTGDEDDASYAWGCYFRHGDQNDTRESAEGAAVAVRLIPLTA